MYLFNNIINDLLDKAINSTIAFVLGMCIGATVYFIIIAILKLRNYLMKAKSFDSEVNKKSRTIEKVNINSLELEKIIDNSKNHIRNIYKTKELEEAKKFLSDHNFNRLDDVLFKDKVEKYGLLFSKPYNIDLIKIIVSNYPTLVQKAYIKWISENEIITVSSKFSRNSEINTLYKDRKKLLNTLSRLNKRIDLISGNLDKTIELDILTSEIDFVTSSLDDVELKITNFESSIFEDNVEEKQSKYIKKLLENEYLYSKIKEISEFVDEVYSKVAIITNKESYSNKKKVLMIKRLFDKKKSLKIDDLFNIKLIREHKTYFTVEEQEVLLYVYNNDNVRSYHKIINNTELIDIKIIREFEDVYFSKKSSKVRELIEKMCTNTENIFFTNNELKFLIPHTINIQKSYNKTSIYVNKKLFAIVEVIKKLMTDICEFYTPDSDYPILEISISQLLDGLDRINNKIELFLKKPYSAVFRGITIEKMTSMMGKNEEIVEDKKESKLSKTLKKVTSLVTMPLKALATSKFVFIGFSEFIITTVGVEISYIYSGNTVTLNIEDKNDFSNIEY